MNWTALLQHVLLFIAICYLCAITVAAYHEEGVGAILRNAAHRTVVLTTGTAILAGVMLGLELLFTYLP